LEGNSIMSHTHTTKLDLYKPALDDTLGASLTGFNGNADILDESVMNAILALWSGTTNITTLGTIVTAVIDCGVW
jgi:hypothetical protein